MCFPVQRKVLGMLDTIVLFSYAVGLLISGILPIS